MESSLKRKRRVVFRLQRSVGRLSPFKRLQQQLNKLLPGPPTPPKKFWLWIRISILPGEGRGEGGGLSIRGGRKR